MTYLARELITNAYYLSGIVAKRLQTVTGDQIMDGLRLLNSLLADKSSDKKLVPYFSEYDLTAVIGQETYFIPNLIEIETFTFNIGNVRFPTQQITRRVYRGSGRIDDVASLPFSWNFERCPGGANLSLYLLPYDTFPLKVWGKFGFSEVTLDTDMSVNRTLHTGYDGFYLDLLRHELAAYICNEYNKPLSPQTAENLEAMRAKDINVSAPDLSMRKRSRFGSGSAGPNWAITNLAVTGFLPPL